jgi:hypothetical protein
MGPHKTKKLCAAKEVDIRLKTQLTKWEKVFVSYTSNKGLITRIYRELPNSPQNQ